MTNQNSTLILGSSKGIGFHLINSFNEQKLKTISVSRKNIELISEYNTHFEFDLLDFENFETLFNKIKKYNIENIIFNLGDGSEKFKNKKKQQAYSENINFNYVEKFLDMPIIELKNLKNIIFINSICRLNIANCREEYQYAKQKLFNFFKQNTVYYSKNGIRLNSITLGDVKHSNSIWNNKFNCKEDEDEYLALTKLNSNYVRLEDISKTVTFIIENNSLIGEDIILDCGHNYLLDN